MFDTFSYANELNQRYKKIYQPDMRCHEVIGMPDISLSQKLQ
jgi:hypothetical protein